MKRRSVLAMLGSAAVGWPPAVCAQALQRVRRVGVLIGGAESDPHRQNDVVALREALAALGWIENANLRLDYQWTGGDSARYRALARNLAGLAPDLILAQGIEGTRAAREGAPGTPIVFVGGIDPTGEGLVGSLARPGGMITGFSALDYSIGGKWLQLLREIFPSLSRCLFLSFPKPALGHWIDAIEPVAMPLGIEVAAAPVRDAEEIERAIRAHGRMPGGGLILPPDSSVIRHRDLVIRLAAECHLPALYARRPAANGAELISYGVDDTDLWRRAAAYVDRILGGAAPGALPIQKATKYELVINLSTANALSLAVPKALLASADRVIQ